MSHGTACHEKRRLPCFQMLACFEAWETEAATGAIEAVGAVAPCVEAPTLHAVPAAEPQRHHLSHKYKTELCTHFAAKGKCGYGSKCVFAHGMSDRR